MLTSCDSTGIDIFQRQSGQSEDTISFPLVIKKFNENIHAVDQFITYLFFLWVNLIHLQGNTRKLQWY